MNRSKKKKNNQKIVLREKEEDNISISTDPNSFLHANLSGSLGLAVGFCFTDPVRYHLMDILLDLTPYFSKFATELRMI